MKLTELEKKIKWSKYYERHSLSFWYNLSSSPNLSEDFIEEFADKLNWIVISGEQILSENFIRKFSNKVSWFEIATKQSLSIAFIKEFEFALEKYKHFMTEFNKNLSTEAHNYCLYWCHK